MRARGSDAQLNVFLALILVLVLSLFLALFDSAAVQCAKSSARDYSLMAVESLFGEYQKDLLEQYEILGIDGGFGGSFSEEALTEEIDAFLSYHTQQDKDLVPLTKPLDWHLSASQAEITAMRLLTDDGAAALREQASDYMQHKYGIALVEELLDFSAVLPDLSGHQQALLSEQGQNARELEELEKEKEESGIEEVPQEEDALEDVAKLRKLSILQVLLEDPEDVSKASVAPASLPSCRTLRKGYGTIAGKKERNGTVDNLLFREYMIQKSTNYTSEKSDGHVLSYELEYIIAGKGSDIENLEGVCTRLLVLREALNFAYLCTDSAKQAQAETMAIATVGYFGIPLLITATKWALLLGWAYIESILDVRTLLKGGKVPLLKTKESWEADLSEIGELIAGGFRIRQDDKSGLTYAQTLRIFLYPGNITTQSMRFLDIVEANIRKREGGGSFSADGCVVALGLTFTWDTGGGVLYTFPAAYAY